MNYFCIFGAMERTPLEMSQDISVHQKHLQFLQNQDFVDLINSHQNRDDVVFV